MIDRLGQHKEVEFVLDSEKKEPLTLATNPKNWNDDEKTYEVDNDSGGVLRKLNTSIEFTKDGYDYLYGSMLSFGVSNEVSVTKWGKDKLSLNETWRPLYQTCLDMAKASWQLDKRIFKVGFKQGGLYDRVKARYSDNYDLVSTKSADGKDIPQLKTIVEQVNDRELLRISEGTVIDDTRIDYDGSQGGDSDTARAVPMEFDPNSDREYIGNVFVAASAIGYSGGNYADGSEGTLMFRRSDRYRVRRLDGKVKLTFKNNVLGTAKMEKVFYLYNESNQTYEFDIKETLATVSMGNGAVLQYDFNNEEIPLQQNGAFALSIYTDVNPINGDDVHYEYTDTQITVTEDDSFPTTPALSLLPHEMIDRLLEKITGEAGLLISNLFGRTDIGYDVDGEWAYLSTSSGFWARGFDLPATGILSGLENLFSLDSERKQFTISLKDALASLNTIEPIVWGIEKRNGKEYFRLEKYSYKHQGFTGIQYGRVVSGEYRTLQASKPEIKVLSDLLYTSATVGFDKGGNDYEEITGLSSPHGTSEFNTSLNNVDEKEYKATSKIRGDVEGYNLARRKQAASTNDEDTPYDQDLFFRHLKKVGNQYFIRNWEDDLDSAPQGDDIYSPDTMGNLLLTPFRCALRHGKLIATAFYKNPLATFNWVSSNCFSKFSTTKDGTELFEDGNVQNSELGTPYVSEFLLSFEGKVYQEMIDQIEGFTTLEGEQIPNWYGKYEVFVEGELFEGRLNKVSINNEGKHEIALIP